MRTITLELLRHGPSHNQLLSPLTPYMALCENHSAETLYVPIEHYQFLHRMKALSYQSKDETARTFQLADTAQLMGNLLGAIPGLTAESNKPDGTDERITHLRLILSASELALLPFELTQAPNGLPGSGQHLLLQSQMPVCLTREIRRTDDDLFVWPRIPRILMIAASPPGVGDIPLPEHLLALRNLITPWVKYFDKDDETAREKRIEEHLVVLTGASIEAIEELCSSSAEKPFTHIHILAHGIERPEIFDTRYYLALHNSQDPSQTDYISGSRLAAALRPAHRPDSNPLARPAVVGLASCDSANGGSVMGAGASIAHALHEAGIPLVIASQFPLSFAGSVSLVKCLYEGLMWGVDPRLLLYDLRRRLYAQFPTTHDWASLTAYMSLPADFNEQLPEIQIQRAMRSIDACMNHADEAISQLSENIKRDNETVDAKNIDLEKMKPLLDDVHERINSAKKKLERLLVRWPAKKARISGLLASTEKRQAEILFRTSEKTKSVKDKKSSEELLRKSRNYYWDVFMADRSQSWAVVQYLSLTMAMNTSEQFPEHNFSEQSYSSLPELGSYDQPDRKLGALWSMALLLSSYDLYSTIKEKAVWAHGNLIELYLLSRIMPDLPNVPPNVEQLAMDHTDALIDIAGRMSFAVYSTRRQIVRYVEWFGTDIQDSPKKQQYQQVIDLATNVFERFPPDVEEAWK